MQIKYKLLRPGALAPSYQTPGAAGMDLFASFEDLYGYRIITPGQHAFYPCGVAIEIPEGYEGQVRPRSGLARKHGITVLNSPGTIDSDYRGEIGVILHNCGDDWFSVHQGMRIAQLVIVPIIRAELIQDELSESQRGTQGFGSTGQ